MLLISEEKELVKNEAAERGIIFVCLGVCMCIEICFSAYFVRDGSGICRQWKKDSDRDDLNNCLVI